MVKQTRKICLLISYTNSAALEFELTGEINPEQQIVFNIEPDHGLEAGTDETDDEIPAGQQEQVNNLFYIFCCAKFVYKLICSIVGAIDKAHRVELSKQEGRPV